MAVFGQRGHTLLDARATGVDERDDRHLEVERLVHEMADLAAFGHAKRAAFDGEVLRVDGHFAAEHLAEAGDDGGARAATVDVAAAETADFLEGTGIKQQVETFARGQLAFDVLATAGVVFGFGGELRGTQHGRTDRLRFAGFGSRFVTQSLLLFHDDLHGLFDGRACDDVGHFAPPSVLVSVLPSVAGLPSAALEAPLTSMVINVSPASMPAAGPTKILVTVPLTGAYT